MIAADLRNGAVGDVTQALQSGGMGDERGLCPNDFESETFVAHPLTAGMAASANRMPHEQGALVAFSRKDHGADAGPDTAPTLRAMGHDGSHANAGGQVAVAFSQNSRDELVESEVMQSLKAGGGKPGQSYPAIRHGWAVRRLTPEECESLQGFPRGYTAVPYRGKPAADGPRYKALGNSMAVNCMRWLGHRIDMVGVHPPRIPRAEDREKWAIAFGTV